MEEQISFKTRVRNAAVQYASDYYSFFLCNDYLVFSDAFPDNAYYIIQAEKDNYLHFIGVTTSLSASEFFDKCFDKTLNENDFEIITHGQDPKSSKGSIRRKIKALPFIKNLISDNSRVEAPFTKNTILCSFASSEGSCTMGFISTPKARPKTLLIGDELDDSKAKPFRLVLSKARIDVKFSTIIVGNDNDLLEYADKVMDMISPGLLLRIERARELASSKSDS